MSMENKDTMYAREGANEGFTRQLFGEDHSRNDGYMGNCGCGPYEWENDNNCNYGTTLAIVASPRQNWCNLYDVETGMSRGTVFKDLDLPFLASNGTKMGGKCCG